MSAKPRLLLLDAGAVFAALRHECWEALVSSYEVIVGSVVVREEAEFYVTRGDERVEIDLPTEVERGRIQEVTVDVPTMRRVRAQFTPEFRERLDDGELEALAYLLTDPRDDLRFVSGDGPAIQAVAMLDEKQRGASLEEALRRIGQTKKLPRQFQPEFTRQHLEEGSIRRIQGRGLVTP
jgi:hypothetical protein